MNFFEQQAQARQRTVWLVVGFALGLALVVYCIYALCACLLPLMSHFGYEVSPSAPQWCAGVVAALIGVGALMGWRNVDGAAVARNMGASPLALTTADPDESRCLQVVQEMAIAAGCPVPGVYVFEDDAINAFSAGGTPQTAVIAVSRGAIAQLTRGELQAVIAHEFSHIFNGDMRLNMRMLGILSGLMFFGVLGQVMWQKRSAQNVVLGLFCLIIGALGLIVAQLIKAAVARQREFLADASAIHFTRNPTALYGALEKVSRRGSLLAPLDEDSRLPARGADERNGVSDPVRAHGQAPRARKQVLFTQLMSHFFFAQAVESRFQVWLATHPAVQERLQAIDGDGLLEFEQTQRFKAQSLKKVADLAHASLDLADGTSLSLTKPENAAEQMEADTVAQLRQRIPDTLKRKLEFPAGAAAVVQGMLLSVRPFVRQAQRDILIEHANVVVAEAALRAQTQMVDLPQVLRLPLLDLAIPALRALAPQEQVTLLKIVNLLVLADGKVNAFELLAQVLLQRNLHPESTVLTPGTAAQHMRVVLSYIAYCGGRGHVLPAKQFYQHAMRRVPDLRLRELLPLQDCQPQTVRRSVLALVGLRPMEKQSFIAAIQACAMHDPVVHVSEWEIVRVLCQCLEVHCPLAPPGTDIRVFVS